MNPPEINSYRFGQISVDGQIYRDDLILLPDCILGNWWRKSGHNLNLDDLKAVLEAAPDVLIVGQGSSSRMKIPNETLQALESAGIETIALPSDEACRRYNQLRLIRKVAAALHLTC